MIDAAAYRRLTAMIRMLVEDGHLTTMGLRTLTAVLDDELRQWKEQR